MNFEYSDKVKELIAQVRDFIDNEVVPAEPTYEEQLAKNPWETPPVLDQLKEKAKAKGLWNLFLPREHGDFTAGLTNLEYAPLAALTLRRF